MQSRWSNIPARPTTASGGVAGLIARPAWQAGLAHRLERVVDVGRRLPVHDQRVGAGGGELLDAPLGALDHQVHVEHAPALVDVVAQRVDDQGADRDRRHEVAVHHVHVDHARAGVHHQLDLLAEAGEVGGEDRGRDAQRPAAAG